MTALSAVFSEGLAVGVLRWVLAGGGCAGVVADGGAMTGNRALGEAADGVGVGEVADVDGTMGLAVSGVVACVVWVGWGLCLVVLVGVGVGVLAVGAGASLTVVDVAAGWVLSLLAVAVRVTLVLRAGEMVTGTVAPVVSRSPRRHWPCVASVQIGVMVTDLGETVRVRVALRAGGPVAAIQI
ncbi:hypothetical protein ACRYCC_40440 [Actinomadura scrupuli]|uniref:hypothetical protein n=1 Tax=Actinomadura scrupuli TaxID=559629 RepID=UPI003D982AB6